jgi:hypothetical protein
LLNNVFGKISSEEEQRGGMICCMSTEFASRIIHAVSKPALIKRGEKLLQNPILTSTSRELCVVG